MEHKELTKIKKTNKITSLFFNLIIFLTLCILIYIAVSAFLTTAYFQSTYTNATELTSYKYDNILENLIYISLLLFIIVIISNIYRNKKVGKFFIILSWIGISVLFIWAVLFFRLRPIVDQGNVVSLAFSTLNDNLFLKVSSGDYLEKFPYQFPFVFYVSIIFKISMRLGTIFWANFHIILQLANVIFSILSMILMYQIGKKMISNEKANKILLVLILLFGMYFMFFNIHIYGNIPGLTFALLSILFTMMFIDLQKVRYIFGIGISISISILLKTNYNIFLIGIFLILFIDLINNVNYKKILGFIIIPAIIIVSQIINNILFVQMTYSEVPKGVPMISYVYMGWAPEYERSAGWYTEDVLTIYEEAFYDSNIAKEKSIELLIDRMKYFFVEDRQEFVRYAFDKFNSTWLNPTFQTIWCATPGIFRSTQDLAYMKYLLENDLIKEMVNFTSDLYHLEEKYMDAYQIIIFTFAIVALFSNKKSNETKFYLPIIIFLGGAAFHFLLWETKAIYVIQYYFLLLPYAAIGLDKAFEIIENKYKLKKENKEKDKG